MSRSPRPGRTVALLIATVLVAMGLPATAFADEVRDDQWQLTAFDAENVWDESTGAGVTVAVVDSGVDARHPDLAGQVLPGIDFVDVRGDGRVDPVGHGTAIASFIAGRNDDSDGVAGLAPAAKILPVRVLDNQNRYSDALTVAKGVKWAVDRGARVINLSLGGSRYSPALADALDYAFARDVVVVACTGNRQPSEPDEVWFPAREPGVIAVTGLDRGGGPDPLWSHALTGAATVLAAPATDLRGAAPNGDYRTVQGTSFAAPLVTATAALLRAKWPRMSAANVIQRLTQTARDLGGPGRDDRFGFGAVDPIVALRAKVAEVSTNQLDTNPPPGVARFGSAGEPPARPDDPAASRRGRASAASMPTPFVPGSGHAIPAP